MSVSVTAPREGLVETAGPGQSVLRETFRADGSMIRHRLELDEDPILEAAIPVDHAARAHDDAKNGWWQSHLLGRRPHPGGKCEQHDLRIADLFCGSGGLALGVRQLCDEAGLTPAWEFIADHDQAATAVYRANHATQRSSPESVADLLDYRVRRGPDGAEFVYPPELLDPELMEAVCGVDLVMAGPPCEGHSNLNNHTRRDDRRNHLYLAVPAFAVAARARMVLIENVPAVDNDRSGVVEAARNLLEASGYRVESGVLAADAMGWPQTRRRFFLVAHRSRAPVPFSAIREGLADDAPRPVWWAIEDLEEINGDDPLHRVGELSEENRARIAWLFDNDAHELDLSERPACHRDGTTYSAVYGRMRRDQPAPTITTGFLTPGRGRFVHPTRRRTLTPREAARLQGFPDTYRFFPAADRPPTRSQLAKWIGDAVPMPLGYAAALSLLAPELGRASRRRKPQHA